MPTRPLRLVPAAPVLALAVCLAAPAGAVSVERVVAGLSAPVYVAAPAGDPRLFVVERAGRIRIVDNGVLRAVAFLDIASRVNTSGEGGLLGLAFAPDYATSRAFYVYYTTGTPMTSRISRFRASASDPNAASPEETVVLAVPQPSTTNHKGGTVAFGPDGMLYMGFGDGGGGGDPSEYAQNPATLLGKMIRIDVSFTSFTDPYRIPPDNPFVGNPAYRPEIWAVGFRNPFRFAFDRQTGDLYVADVGEDSLEEIDVESATAPGGRNYGWDVMEGTSCFEAPDPGEPACNAPSLTPPVYEYSHSLGCSVTGGTVYRGSQSALRGHYLFADYCSGRIWSLVWNGAGGIVGNVVDRTAELTPPSGQGTISSIVGFGESGSGELLIVDGGGELFRVVPAVECANGVDDDGDGLVDFSAAGTGDSGCVSAADLSEHDPARPCDDGADNDGDGRSDFRAGPSGDLGCRNALSGTENPQCQDGVDNDGATGIDFDGGASRNGGVPLAVRDPQCAYAWQPKERAGCGLGFELALLAPLLVRLRAAAGRRGRRGPGAIDAGAGGCR